MYKNRRENIVAVEPQLDVGWIFISRFETMKADLVLLNRRGTSSSASPSVATKRDKGIDAHDDLSVNENMMSMMTRQNENFGKTLKEVTLERPRRRF